MKIAFFTDTYLPQQNGVATSVSYFFNQLKKMNQQVRIIAPEIKDYLDQDSDIIRLSSSKIWPTIPDSARLPLPDRKWLQLLNNDYQIIHAHGNGLFSLLGLIIAKRKKIPFVLTFHTLFDQYSHYFLGGKILTPAAINKLVKTFANKCDAIIAPSEKMKIKLIELGVKKPISIIPNFVDSEKFTNTPTGFLRQRLKLQNNARILLAVGRLGKEKNFNFLVRMFSHLDFKNLKTHLVIVGNGPEKENLNKLVKVLGLEAYVHLIGGIRSDVMPAVYADADVFVFASKSEVHPMVAIEAAASSLPLVITEDPAFKMVVEDKINGFIAPPNHRDFAHKVQLLLNNQKLRKQMAKRSREIIQKNFVKENITASLLQVYQNLLDKNYS